MQLILNKDVPSLGSTGDVVNVRPGYGRNYLVPRGLAMVATARNKAALDHQLKILKKKREQDLAAAKGIASQVEKISVTVTKQVGEEEKIFGTVTTAELEALLENEGVKVDKKDIKILEDIKKVGVYTAEVKLHSEVSAKFKVWVVSQ
ncbi:MAG: 50S ribosomal protein L9 [Oligoflexales bacterium]